MVSVLRQSLFIFKEAKLRDDGPNKTGNCNIIFLLTLHLLAKHYQNFFLNHAIELRQCVRAIHCFYCEIEFPTVAQAQHRLVSWWERTSCIHSIEDFRLPSQTLVLLGMFRFPLDSRH